MQQQQPSDFEQPVLPPQLPELNLIQVASDAAIDGVGAATERISGAAAAAAPTFAILIVTSRRVEPSATIVGFTSSSSHVVSSSRAWSTVLGSRPSWTLSISAVVLPLQLFQTFAASGLSEWARSFS